MIKAQIVADSLSPQGNRLTTMLVTFPRFILAEGKTHRVIKGMIQETSIGLNDDDMLSKNSASSRAIPLKKMIRAVKENPFIPIAWQKEHSGMQGTEYCNEEETKALNVNHLAARDYVVSFAENVLNLGGTKQIANRYLEPFMWHTVLISGTEWENFFSLRCPKYSINCGPDDNDKSMLCEARSWKDLMTTNNGYAGDFNTDNIVERLSYNKGQAEIHMMALAEAIWDAMNESTPKQLQAGEWHIPFGDKVDTMYMLEEGKTIKEVDISKIKISTAMAARTSYTVVGDEKEVSYETLLSIHDKMAIQVPFHASPFEHCAKAMSKEEYSSFIKDQIQSHEEEKMDCEILDYVSPEGTGWCRNYRGFIQYRHILENSNKI